uniref:THH1/TOM1/TOM3 domain-containing protein n=1 Tax=Leptocylindrus danicus TaxID=163516 RepID=A0A7S2LPL8_9STRA|mmetsp:Transcript_7552/g.11237  ORF Transcript_7552/g.11237 Transcript_7552/m.11237 type:complete len:340 (+) Transcript_7552:45-1064(+)
MALLSIDSTEHLFELLNILGFVSAIVFCAVELGITHLVIEKAKSRITNSNSSPDLQVDNSPGNKKQGNDGPSKGDETRHEFYRLLLAALSSRLILLLAEGYMFQEVDCTESVYCTLARTVPDFTFASAFAHLVQFYANLVETANGRPVAFSESFFERTNIFLYSVYFIMIALVGTQVIDFDTFVSAVYFFLAGIYGILFFGIAYFGPTLIKLLQPSLQQRSSLAFRLVGMCFICIIVFLCRTITFLTRATNHAVPFTSLDNFLNDNITFCLFELIPSLAILCLMRQSKSNSSSASAGDQSGNNNSRSGGNNGNMRRVNSASANKALLPKNGNGGGYGAV